MGAALLSVEVMLGHVPRGSCLQLVLLVLASLLVHARVVFCSNRMRVCDHKVVVASLLVHARVVFCSNRMRVCDHKVVVASPNA